MPTTRPRHSITESDDVVRALDAAAERWPEQPRSRLLLRLVEEGRRAIERERAAEKERWLQAIRESSGSLTGVYPPGYLEKLRMDWPE